MKKAIYIIVSIAIMAFIIVILVSNKETVDDKVFRYDRKQEILVTEDTALQRTLSEELIYTGTFEPMKEGKVMAESQGKIIKLNTELGDYIKAGAIVAQLDIELLKLQLESINVQIEGFEKDVNRYTILEKAEAVQGIQLEKILLALRSAEIQRKMLLEQISKSTIRSPFNGIVTQKFTELGSVVSPLSPIIQISDISSLNLTINVSESDIKYFKYKSHVDVVSDIVPVKTLTGLITMIGSKGDMAHNFPVQIRVNNTKEQLIKSGMFGRIKINKGNIQSYISISSKALFGSSLKQQVYVVKNGKAILSNVIVAFQSRDFTAITHGLKEGDIVITSGFINLKNGTLVRTESPVKNY